LEIPRSEKKKIQILEGEKRGWTGHLPGVGRTGKKNQNVQLNASQVRAEKTEVRKQRNKHRG